MAQVQPTQQRSNAGRSKPGLLGRITSGTSVVLSAAVLAGTALVTGGTATGPGMSEASVAPSGGARAPRSRKAEALAGRTMLAALDSKTHTVPNRVSLFHDDNSMARQPGLSTDFVVGPQSSLNKILHDLVNGQTPELNPSRVTDTTCGITALDIAHNWTGKFHSYLLGAEGQGWTAVPGQSAVKEFVNVTEMYSASTMQQVSLAGTRPGTYDVEIGAGISGDTDRDNMPRTSVFRLTVNNDGTMDVTFHGVTLRPDCTVPPLGQKQSVFTPSDRDGAEAPQTGVFAPIALTPADSGGWSAAD